MTTFQQVHSSAEIAEVVRLAREIWQEHYVPIIGQQQVDYMLDKFQSEGAVQAQLRGAYEYYLLRHGGQSVGYAAVVPDAKEPVWLLSKIYVRQAERGRGLGKELLRFVEGLGRARGIQRLWLTVNKNNAGSIAWYLRRGFRNAGPSVADIGGGFVMDDFRMEKSL